MKKKKINKHDIKIWDNLNFNDRYTVLIDFQYIYGMNDMPFHPAYGFSQFVGEVSDRMRPGKHWGKRLEFDLLNDDVKKAIMQRIEE